MECSCRVPTRAFFSVVQSHHSILILSSKVKTPHFSPPTLGTSPTMPFSGRENSASLELFFDSLPPLEESSGCAQPTAAQQSLFEGLQELRSSGSSGSATLYRLVLLDEAGKPQGYPSEHDLARLIEGRPLPAPKVPKPEQQEAPAVPAPREPSFQELLAETHKRGGPVCSHCGAT